MRLCCVSFSVSREQNLTLKVSINEIEPCGWEPMPWCVRAGRVIVPGLGSCLLCRSRERPDLQAVLLDLGSPSTADLQVQESKG